MQVTFISGDVHVAGLGRICTRPVTNLRTDHRFMPQVRGRGEGQGAWQVRGGGGEGQMKGVGGGDDEGPGISAELSGTGRQWLGEAR